MDGSKLRQDVERQKISIDDLIEMFLDLTREVRQLKDENRRFKNELDQAQQRLAKYEPEVLNPPAPAPETKPQVDENGKSLKYSLESEEKRRAKKRRRPKSPGRTPTAVKLDEAERIENLYPKDVRPKDCTPSTQRVVWRIEAGEGKRVGYQLHTGPNGEQSKVPDVLPNGEYDLQIVVTVVYLTYSMRLSMDQVCELINFFWKIPLRKSQADALLNQLARHWKPEFDRIFELLALAAVVGTDETGWTINGESSNATVFASPDHVLLWFGCPKGKDTLHKVLPPETFKGVLLSDNHSTYKGLALAQKCWAHLLRKAIQLRVLYPEHDVYRKFLDDLLDLYRDANHRRKDQRLSEAGRKQLAKAFTKRLQTLCHPYAWPESRTFQSAHAREHHLLAAELYRLCEFGELFTFVECPEVPGTNNGQEQALRGPAASRDLNRTSKTDNGALRRSICTSVLNSLARSLPEVNLTTVTKEIATWFKSGISRFTKQLRKLRRERRLALDSG